MAALKSSADGLAPLHIESTPAVVAARIRAGIFARRFSPDAQLNEVELARELNVSRGPIREAFARLVHEGLLRQERNRGVFVVALTDESIRDICYAREIVERAAASRIAERHDDVALSSLDAALQDIELATDSDCPDLLALDLEFHSRLVSAAGSERLTRAFEPLYAETRLCLSQLGEHEVNWADLVDAHRRILAAIRTNDDADLIRQLLHDHITNSVAKLGASREGT